MKVKQKSTGLVFVAEKRMRTFADGSKYIYYRDVYDDEEFPESDIIEMVDDAPYKDGIDWEQRRYEIAKDVFCALETTNHADGGFEPTYQAQHAVSYADLLIEELKKK